MTAFKRFTPVVAAFLVWAAPALYADMASGDYTNSFDGLINVWDIAGSYSEDLQGISLDYTINTEPSGKFSGSGTASVQDTLMGASVDLDMDLTFNGTVTSAGNLVRATMTMKMKGGGYVEDYYCTFRATVTERLEIDQTNRLMTGWASGGATVSVPSMHRSASAPLRRTYVETALPYDTTGNWDLTLSVSTNKAKYLGSATILLDNGRTFPLVATGSYARRTDVSTINLKGLDVNRAINLRLTGWCTNAQMMIKNVTGKVLGQSLHMPKNH